MDVDKNKKRKRKKKGFHAWYSNRDVKRTCCLRSKCKYLVVSTGIKKNIEFPSS